MATLDLFGVLKVNKTKTIQNRNKNNKTSPACLILGLMWISSLQGFSVNMCLTGKTIEIIHFSHKLGDFQF